MATSTITNFSSNINVLYPVAGQDNDTQGFRDNFANIKNAFEIAGSEISNLITNQAELLKEGATVTLQGDVSGGAAGAKIILQSSTITSAQGVVTIDGKGLSVGKGESTSTVLTGVHGGTSFPYNNYFSVSRKNKIEIGSTFKFTATTATVYTVKDITRDFNTNTIYTDVNFNPSELASQGVTAGSTIEFNIAVRADGVYRASIPPSSLLGEPGDTAGKMVPTTTGLFVATKDYDGTSKIWTKLQANAVTSALVAGTSTLAYSISSPNSTCDLSSSTQFYFHNTVDDLGINFVNPPATPYMVEARVVIFDAVDTVDSIYVEGGPATVYWTTSTGTKGVYSQFNFTIIGYAPGSVTVLGKAEYFSDVTRDR